MSMLEMHVISNGGLAREVINAVVTLLGSATFATAIKISLLFSILAATVNYVRGKDLVVLAKWFMIYFGITFIILAPRVDLEIIDSSNPGAVYTVGNVPYGFAYPASLITSVSYGLVSVFEEAFHMPDDFAYNKTGMLFGSKLFRLSSEFNVVNPEVKSQLNEYVKNCVLGDILINKKYSMGDLTESKDLFDTISKSPSNIRGIYVGGRFKTCLGTTNDLRKNLENDVKENTLKRVAERLFGKYKNVNQNTNLTERLQTSLQNVYNQFSYGSLSNSALQIATQNVLINGIRDGLLNYTAETGSTAALLNYSTTQAMDKMRMSYATSRNVATYIMPVMHTVLLLLMLGLFPIIVFLSFQPNLTAQVLKNYLYTLLWIESWPLMFACLNLIVTFYAKEIGPGGLTISNIDQLALHHSDMSNMAGYLMLSVPFISGGLVKGMSSAFNHAASYIGGVMQSSVSSSASETATGNIHMGNSSWNNVNANKFDTNSTLMRGMATEQLSTGVLRSSRPDGETMYDASHAISKLPTNVRSSDILSSSFSEQAEIAKAATVQDQKAYDQAISSSASELNTLGRSLDSRESFGDSFSSRESVSAATSASNMHNIAETIAKRNHMDADDVFKGMVNFSQGGKVDLGGSFSYKTPNINVGSGWGVDLGLKGNVGAEHVRSSESSTRYGIGRSIDVTAEEAKRFSEDLHKVEEYGMVSHAETSKSAAASHLSQLSTDLRDARTASEQYSVHKSESERFSSAASYVKQHSGQIDSDLGQEVVNYVVGRVGRKEAELLFAGKNRAQLEGFSRDYIRDSGIENDIMSKYQQGGFGINPEQKYNSAKSRIEDKKADIGIDYADNAKAISVKENAKELEFDRQKFEQIQTNSESKLDKFKNDLEEAKNSSSGGYNKMQAEVAENVKDGAKVAERSAFNLKRGATKPGFLKPNKEKK